MTRAELQAVVETVLGIHANADRVDTIMRCADVYAFTAAAADVAHITTTEAGLL